VQRFRSRNMTEDQKSVSFAHWQSGRTQRGLGLKPFWVWYFTKTLWPAQRRLIVLQTFCLLIFGLTANTTEWICMQILRNIVNGPKSNWVIVCVQKPYHHFLQTFHPLHIFKIVLRDSSFYPIQLSLSYLLWLNSASADR